MASNPSTGFDFNRPTIISLLFLAGMFTGGIAPIVGVVLAYVWKGEPHEPWEATHYTYQIRTFWITLIAGFVGMLLLILVIGFLIWLAAAVWCIVRAVLSLINAQKRMPMADPQSLLF